MGEEEDDSLQIKRTSSDNGVLEMKHLRPNDVFHLPEGVGGIKVEVEWICPHNGIADLDVFVLLYDENVSILGLSIGILHEEEGRELWLCSKLNQSVILVLYYSIISLKESSMLFVSMEDEH